jgi:hypothetical protein
MVAWICPNVLYACQTSGSHSGEYEDGIQHHVVSEQSDVQTGLMMEAVCTSET